MRFRPTLASAVLTAVLTTVTICHAGESLSLLATIGQWQYPGSKINGATMRDAATVNRNGERTVPSVLCKTVLTTKDPMAKVIEYYEAKLKKAADPKTAKPEGKSGTDAVTDPGRSVMIHDDSQGRPLGVHIILVNMEKSSTTLVISRAETESETHIAWTHYVRY
jgi:hypothetical protein